MNNPWKLATLGLALTGVTALSTGLATAYLLRPTMPSEATVTTMPAASAYTPAPRAVPARMVAHPAVMTEPAATVATTEGAGSRAIATPAPVAARVVRTADVQTVATDCSTGGQRAMKIAKPGIIGALAGAGLGAVGGAIADGGKAAGKGALIGGIAGAALGGGYGAYKTKQECGTIFGNNSGFASGALQAAAPVIAPQAALYAVPGASNGIQVFNAR